MNHPFFKTNKGKFAVGFLLTSVVILGIIKFTKLGYAFGQWLYVFINN